MPMTNIRPGLLTAFLVILFATGCVSRRSSCAPPQLARASGLISANPTAEEPSVLDTDLVKSLADRLRTANSPDFTAPTKRAKILALSSGGAYGAYGVGVLAGWTATGTRPEFDVVTGVSTGALIGTYAFLGSNYDRRAAELYTSLTDRDVFRRRLAGSLLWGDSVASSAPLKRLIEIEVDENILIAVAKAHACGRRFYVGTTNLNTKRLVIWDMGGIASSGRPDSLELYRKVLLASAAIPGFLPPVEFDVTINGQQFTELHADGGATTGVFVRASTLPVHGQDLKGSSSPLSGSDVYVIVSGKLYADPNCTDRRTVKIGESSLQSLLYSQARAELFRIYTLCLLGGMNYHLASIPEDFPAPREAMKFNPEESRKLYSAGFAAVTSGQAWRATPPGAEAHEQIRPRTGNDFLAPGAASVPTTAP